MLELADGARHVTRRVVLATGMDYRYPELPGIAERWGESVFHCPFCHGWEVRDGHLGVLDRGADGVHRALLLRAWSDDVTLLTDGPDELTDDEAATLAARRRHRRRPPRGRAAGSRPHADPRPVHRRDEPPDRRPAGPGAAAPALDAGRRARATTTATPLAADAIDVDMWMQTSVAGLAAAGDVSVMPSVANAIAAGSMAASGVVRSLVLEAP